MQRPSREPVTLRECLLTIKQTTGDVRGCLLFFSLSRGTERDQVSFFFFRNHAIEANNVINGLIKICKTELRIDLTVYFTPEGIERAATGHWDEKNRAYRDSKEVYVEEICAEMTEDIPGWEPQVFNSTPADATSPTETVLNPGHVKMMGRCLRADDKMATVIDHTKMSTIPILAPRAQLQNPPPIITPVHLNHINKMTTKVLPWILQIKALTLCQPPSAQ